MQRPREYQTSSCLENVLQVIDDLFESNAVLDCKSARFFFFYQSIQINAYYVDKV